MLTVVLKSRTMDVSNKQNELERHVPFHNGSLPKLDNEEIDFIQADGNELEDIIASFTIGTEQITIPLPANKRVVRWYGEMARFIYQNIR